MNLQELKEAVDHAVRMADEMGQFPQNIPVTIQIDDEADPHHGYVQTDRELELHYDGDLQSSGCVIQGWRDTTENIEKVLRDAGYKTVSGYGSVRNTIADCADESLPEACSGHGVFPDGRKCDGCPDCKDSHHDSDNSR